jgi:drug/metabolite transporter (DMT)-like permease
MTWRGRFPAGPPWPPAAAAPTAGRAVTGAGQPLAVALALAASVCFAVAAVTQQRAAARLPSQRAFDPAVLLRLIRRPAWLAGLAAVIAGFVLQAAALGLGRLVVIEPVLATSLLFALALAARRDRRRLRRTEWAAALAVVAGLAVFLAAGQPAGGQRTVGAAALGLTAAAAAVLVGACTALGRPLSCPAPGPAVRHRRRRGRRGDRCAGQVGGGGRRRSCAVTGR